MEISKSNAIELHWWRHSDPAIRNVGDELSPLMVELASGRTVRKASLETCDLVAIGSILSRVVNSNRKKPIWIWGSGFIKEDGKRKSQKLRLAAVRGPLSAERLVGVPRPKALGDPAILADSLLRQPVQVRWEIGIVPHYVDIVLPLMAKINRPKSGATVISPMLSPEEFVERIASCRAIISSSLHGLVVADSVGVPNMWVEFSNQIIGKGYKYRDYLANFGIVDPAPQQVSEATDICESLIRKVFLNYKRPGIEQMKKNLVAAFPPI